MKNSRKATLALVAANVMVFGALLLSRPGEADARMDGMRTQVCTCEIQPDQTCKYVSKGCKDADHESCGYGCPES